MNSLIRNSYYCLYIFDSYEGQYFSMNVWNQLVIHVEKLNSYLITNQYCIRGLNVKNKALVLFFL